MNNHRLQFPNPSAVYHIDHRIISAIPPTIGAQIKKHAIALTRLNHRVGICHRSCHCFFSINRLCTVFCSIDHNICPVFRLGGHAHNIWLFSIKQCLIICVLSLPGYVITQACLCHYIFSQIGTRNQIGPLTCSITRRVRICKIAIHLIVNKCTHSTASNQCCTIDFHDFSPVKC